MAAPNSRRDYPLSLAQAPIPVLSSAVLSDGHTLPGDQEAHVGTYDQLPCRAGPIHALPNRVALTGQYMGAHPHRSQVHPSFSLVPSSFRLSSDAFGRHSRA